MSIHEYRDHKTVQSSITYNDKYLKTDKMFTDSAMMEN